MNVDIEEHRRWTGKTESQADVATAAPLHEIAGARGAARVTPA